jgi:hypothetical protein
MRRVIASLIALIWAVGCAETAYRHMNDPSRDAWKKPKEVVDRIAYFRSLKRHLKPNGLVTILDFHPHGFFSGLLGFGTPKTDVRREMEAGGYRLVNDYDLVERQYFQIFSRREP